MTKKLLQVLLFALSFSVSIVVKAQIEIIPAKVIWTSTEAPKINSNIGFALGVNGKQNFYLSHDTNQRIGINTAISVPLQGTSHRLDGKLNILYNSSAQNNGLASGPHLILDEFEPNDYARLRFRNSVLTGSGFGTTLEVRPTFWDLKGMAHNGGEASDRFQIAHNGIDPNLSLTGDGKVGFGMTNPIEFFHFKKTDFANLLWESNSPKWKIKNLSNSSAVTDSEINFQNFNNVSVLKVGYRQIPSLSPDKVAYIETSTAGITLYNDHITHDAYTKLGDENDSPGIKTKIIYAASPSTVGTEIDIPHGLVFGDRILNVEVVLERTTGVFQPLNYYKMSITWDDINLKFYLFGNLDSSFTSRPIKLWVTYTE